MCSSDLFPSHDSGRKCLEDDAETWKHELEYNIQDVLLLEQVYLKLRPFDNASKFDPLLQR